MGRKKKATTEEEIIEELEVERGMLELKPDSVVISASVSLTKLPDGYNPEYCDKLIKYFSRNPYETVNIGDGKKKLKANDLPLMSSFATQIGISQNRIRDWIKKYPEFKEAVEKAKDIQETILVINALKGLYIPTISTFALKNLLGWMDKTKTEMVTELNINNVIGRVEEKTKSRGFLDD